MQFIYANAFETFENTIKRDYNKFCVPVSTVVSPMNENSCIDLHNARKFENISKIHISHNHNNETIIGMGFFT